MGVGSVVSDEIHVAFVYDGEALKNHTIDAKLLAEVFIGVTDLVQRANLIINGGLTVDITTEVCAIETGCVKTVLRFLRKTDRHLYLLDKKDAVVTVIGLIGFSYQKNNPFVQIPSSVVLSWNLFSFLFKTIGRGKRIVTTGEKNENSEVPATVEDREGNRETCLVPEPVLELAEDKKIRQNAKEIVKPLTNNGIEKLKIQNQEGVDLQNITKSEAVSFVTATEEEQLLHETVSELPLSFETISFKEGNKWKFSDGEKCFSASIKDREFLNDVVESKIRFSKSDMLKAEVKTIQKFKENKLQTEYEIIKVLNLLPISPKPATEQIPLNLNQSDSDINKR